MVVVRCFNIYPLITKNKDLLLLSLEEKNTLIVRFHTSNYVLVLFQVRMDSTQYDSRRLNMNVTTEL
jgi:hypothetical protein